jgi:hypothetical protein
MESCLHLLAWVFNINVDIILKLIKVLGDCIGA